MPYCVECGVELAASAEECPLCGTPVIRPSSPPSAEQDYASSDEIEDMLAQRPPGYERKLTIQILTVVLVTPILVSVVVDWLISSQPTWSLYVGVSMVALWVYSVAPLIWYRHAGIILTVCLTMTGLLMWTVDVLDERTSWFLGIGLPVFAVLVGVTAVVAAAILLSRRRGANVAGYILVGVIIACAAIDVLTKRYVGADGLPLTWSLIVAASILPVVVFLFYYHLALSTKINLRKRMHL